MLLKKELNKRLKRKLMLRFKIKQIQYPDYLAADRKEIDRHKTRKMILCFDFSELIHIIKFF